MIKFLYNNFRNMPGIGNPIKVAYIGSLVKDVLKDGTKSSSAGELSSMAASDIESELKKQANQMFDEFIMPEITANNIPAALVKPAKEKAISKIVKELRKRTEGAIKNKVADKQ